jgi:ABC-type bacteriocin/lantibiotic exporter with double-glycine peptidase domain
MKKLITPMPYISQEDVGAKAFANDCGPTCLAMMFAHYGLARNISVDRICRDIGIAPRGKGSFAGLNQLIFAASKYGLKLKHHRPVALPEIVLEIDADRPVLALIHYGSLSRRQSTFNGGHFVVVTGYDDSGLLVHDPDWWGSRRVEGEYLPVPYLEFATAFGPIGARKAGNLPSQALFVIPR